MPQPLTREQFQKARDSGFSTEQIITFEKRRLGQAEKTPISATPFLPREQQVEQKIQERGSQFQGLKDIATQIKERPSSLFNPVTSPFATQNIIMKGIPAVAGAALRTAEAPLASTALELQKGKIGTIPTQAVKAITGKRPAELGDVIRTTGFGGILNDPLAATTGLLAASAIGARSKSGQQAIKGIEKTAKKVAMTPIEAVRNASTNLKNIRKPAEFSQKVRSAIFGKKKELGQALDNNITKLSNANPDVYTDLREPFYQMKSIMDDVTNNPGLRGEINTIIRRVKDPQQSRLLKSLIDNPESAKQLTLRQAENMKRAISQSPTIQRVYAQGKFAKLTSGETEIIDLLDNIKNLQSEVFPQLSEIRKPYAEYMGAYNKVKNSFKEGRLLGKLRKGFGDEEVIEAIKKVLPEDVYKEVTGFRRTGKALSTGSRAALGGLGLYGAKEILENIFSNK